MKRILIIDPNAVSRRALMLLIRNRIPDVRICEAGDLKQITQQVETKEPDLIIFDDNLFGRDCPIIEIIEKFKKCQLILMSLDLHNKVLAESLGAGFIHKGTPPDRVIELINNLGTNNSERHETE